MTRRFRLWYYPKEESHIVLGFEEVNNWFLKSSAHHEVRYAGSIPCDKSKEWGKEWKKAYLLNYYSPGGTLYFDVGWCNFLDEKYVVMPKVEGTVTISYTCDSTQSPYRMETWNL